MVRIYILYVTGDSVAYHLYPKGLRFGRTYDVTLVTTTFGEACAVCLALARMASHGVFIASLENIPMKQ